MTTLASRHDSGESREAHESWDPPQRISSIPPLPTHEEQARFLCSPAAVLESLGLRIPAALARYVRRAEQPTAPETPASPTVPAANMGEVLDQAPKRSRTRKKK